MNFATCLILFDLFNYFISQVFFSLPALMQKNSLVHPDLVEVPSALRTICVRDGRIKGIKCIAYIQILKA